MLKGFPYELGYVYKTFIEPPVIGMENIVPDPPPPLITVPYNVEPDKIRELGPNPDVADEKDVTQLNEPPATGMENIVPSVAFAPP
jgi:hypothetical protein